MKPGDTRATKKIVKDVDAMKIAIPKGRGRHNTRKPGKTRPPGWLNVLGLCLCLGLATAAEKAVTLTENFENGMERWTLLEPRHWTLQKTNENTCLVLNKPGKQHPPVRRPGEYALWKSTPWYDVTIQAKVKTLRPANVSGRDVCIIFGFRDPTHFYYAHLCSDSNGKTHNVIMKVNGERRNVIMNEKRPEPRLTDDWHSVKVVRKSSGAIHVFMDDMQTPLMTAHDQAFPVGQVGIGTFDDPAMFDDVTIRGTPAEKAKP